MTYEVNIRLRDGGTQTTIVTTVVATNPLAAIRQTLTAWGVSEENLVRCHAGRPAPGKEQQS